MKILSPRFCSIALMVLLVAFCCTPLYAQRQKSVLKVDKNRIAEHYRRLNMWGPEIKIVVDDPVPSSIFGLYDVGIHADAGNNIKLDDKVFLSKDGRMLLRADVIEVDRGSFQQNLDRLDVPGRPLFGDPDPSVKLVVFSDFQCPFCKREAEELRSKLEESFPKGVQVAFQDFPLDQLHPWSKPAAIAGRCVFRQGVEHFWKYHDWVFAHQDELALENFAEKFMVYAQGANLDLGNLKVCIADTRVAAEVEHSVELGRSLRIVSLPAIFVNGRPLQNPSWDQLRQAITYELKYPQSNAGCDCGFPSGTIRK
jgi:protein-disulfide isomerase